MKISFEPKEMNDLTVINSHVSAYSEFIEIDFVIGSTRHRIGEHIYLRIMRGNDNAIIMESTDETRKTLSDFKEIRRYKK